MKVCSHLGFTYQPITEITIHMHVSNLLPSNVTEPERASRLLENKSSMTIYIGYRYQGIVEATYNIPTR